MIRKVRAVALALGLLVITNCSRSDPSGGEAGIKRTYSLCPRGPEALQVLVRRIRSFAEQEGARLVDRSTAASQELETINSDVLHNTGGVLTLMTVEKNKEFRVTVTNAGLKEKVALSVRTWIGDSNPSSVEKFREQLKDFWTIQEVQAGVTDIPPC